LAKHIEQVCRFQKIWAGESEENAEYDQSDTHPELPHGNKPFPNVLCGLSRLKFHHILCIHINPLSGDTFANGVKYPYEAC
jgi:hypothetical protein